MEKQIFPLPAAVSKGKCQHALRPRLTVLHSAPPPGPPCSATEYGQQWHCGAFPQGGGKHHGAQDRPHARMYTNTSSTPCSFSHKRCTKKHGTCLLLQRSVLECLQNKKKAHKLNWNLSKSIICCYVCCIVVTFCQAEASSWNNVFNKTFSTLFYTNICCSFQSTFAPAHNDIFHSKALCWYNKAKNKRISKYVFHKKAFFEWLFHCLANLVCSWTEWLSNCRPVGFMHLCSFTVQQCGGPRPAPFMQSRQSRGRPGNTKCLINSLICCDCRAWKACFLAIWGQENPVPCSSDTHTYIHTAFAIHYLAYFHVRWWE